MVEWPLRKPAWISPTCLNSKRRLRWNYFCYFCGVCRWHFVISTLWPLTSNMLFVFLFSKYSSHCPSDMSLTCLVFVVNFLAFLQNWFEFLMLLSSSFLHLSLHCFSLVTIKRLYRLPVEVSVTIQTWTWKCSNCFFSSPSNVSKFHATPFIWKHRFATLFCNQI